MCVFYVGQYWHRAWMVVMLICTIPVVFPSSFSLTDMGLLSRLLFILLHDWNYSSSLLNDRVILIHQDHWLWHVCCKQGTVCESVRLSVSLRSLCSALWFSLIRKPRTVAIFHHHLPLGSLELPLTHSKNPESGIGTIVSALEVFFSVLPRKICYNWSSLS